MAVDISKPVDQVLADAKKDLADAFPKEADKIAAGQKLEEALYGEDVKRKAYEDMRNLSNNIRNTRVGLTDVAAILVKFDAEKFKDKNGNVINLGPEWSPYIRQYDDTLQYSLEIATNAVMMIKSINAVLGDVQPPDGQDLKAELEQFIRILEQKVRESQGLKDKFQKLVDDITHFITKIDAALEKAAESTKDELQRAKAALKDLQTKLADIRDKIGALGEAVVSSVAPGAAAAGRAIATLSPYSTTSAMFLVVSSISTGVALKKATDERQQLSQSVGDKAREIAEINGRNEQTKKYKTDIDNLKIKMDDLALQMVTTMKIWGIMKEDMRALNEDLKAELGSKDTLSNFFLKKLRVAREVYKHFVFILEMYVEQIRSG